MVSKHTLSKVVKHASAEAKRLDVPWYLVAGYIADAIDLHFAESRAVDAEARLREMAADRRELTATR